MVYGLNDVDKRYIYKLMHNVKLIGSIIFDSHIHMNTGNEIYDVSLVNSFQERLTKKHRKYGVIDQGKS